MPDCCTLKIAGEIVGYVCCNSSTIARLAEKWTPTAASIAAVLVSIAVAAYNFAWLPRKQRALDLLSDFLSTEMRDAWTRANRILSIWKSEDLPRLRAAIACDLEDKTPVEQRFTPRTIRQDPIKYISPSGESAWFTDMIGVQMRIMGAATKEKALEALLAKSDEKVSLFLFLHFAYVHPLPDEEWKKDTDALKRAENFVWRVARLYQAHVVSRKYCRKFFFTDFERYMEANGFMTICEQLAATHLTAHGNFSWSKVLPDFYRRMKGDHAPQAAWGK